MPTLKLEVESLLLADPQQTRSTVHVGVAHPTPLEEAALGKLFLVVEIDSPDRLNHEIIGALQEELKTAYYHSTEFSVEAAFESALQRANNRLHRFITDGATAWLDGFNAMVVVVKNDTVSFGHVGRIHAFLFRGNRITDVTGKSVSPEPKRNPLKIFSSILTGHLEANDRLLFCTSSLLDYFSQEKLKRLVIEDLPAAAVAKLEHSLLIHPPAVAFGALLFAFLSADQRLEPQPTPLPMTSSTASAPQRSMDELIAKERTTEQLLSPSIMPTIKALTKTSSASLSSFIRTRILRLPPRRRPPPTLYDSTRFGTVAAPRRAAPTLQRIGIRVLLAILAAVRGLGRMGQRRRRITDSVQGMPQQALGRTRRFIRWFRLLPPMQKGILLAAVVALFLLSQSVVSLSKNRQQQLRGQEAKDAILTIEDNISQARAALTYEDYSSARQLLNDSTALLEKLPKRKRSEKNTRTALAAKLEEVRTLTRRIVTPNISTVADLTHMLAGTTPTSIALVGSTLVATTGAAGTLLRVDPIDGEITTVTETTAGVHFAVPLDTQTVMLGTSNDELFEYSLRGNAVRTLDVPLTNVDRDLTAAAVFQSRLYLLDPKNNSILRANRAGTSFGPTVQWLKSSDVSVRDGTGIAVDGSIYVATSSGTILKLSAGLRDDVAFESVDPVLRSPTDIWTNELSASLYVLEPSERRLLVFRKSSRSLQAQYVADEFRDALALTVNERTSTIYLLTRNSILKFEKS